LSTSSSLLLVVAVVAVAAAAVVVAAVALVVVMAVRGGGGDQMNSVLLFVRATPRQVHGAGGAHGADFHPQPRVVRARRNGLHDPHQR
jgi:hypothetical protein